MYTHYNDTVMFKSKLPYNYIIIDVSMNIYVGFWQSTL